MVWIFIILLVFTGIFTYFQLPKREIPEINVNMAQISTVYPGATPNEVERTITNPYEQQLMNVDGIADVESASTTGFSTITLTLEDDASREDVFANVRQSVTDVARRFPNGVQQSTVQTDFRMSAVASYHFVDHSYDHLYALRDTIDKWEQTMMDINGVSDVVIKGLPEEVLTLTLDNDAILAQQLSPYQVVDRIKQELSPSAIGKAEENGQQYQLQVEKTSDWRQLENIAIGQTNDGKSIYVKDIGSVEKTFQNTEDLITYKGKPALSFTIFAEEGVNMASLQQIITDKVANLSTELPSQTEVQQFYTQNKIIEEVFTNLLISFSISLIAVLVIMLIGLPFSSAILVALSIPISVIIGLIPLPYAGVDLNQISIIGIIIAIGILVDDAIVVNDSIQRRFQLGDHPWEGTVKGVIDVRKSIITSTLMIMFSFLPLTFLSGSNGDFIRALPTTLIMTIIASTLIALTLIPTVQYVRRKRVNKPVHQVGLLGGLFKRIENGYADHILPFVTNKPFVVGLTGVVACGLLASLVIKIPFEFFPEADRQEVTISVTFPEGTTMEDTQNSLEEMEKIIQKASRQTISETAVFAGSGLPNLFSSSLKRSGDNTGQLLVRVNKDEISASSFISDWEQPLRKQFREAEIFFDTIVSGPPPSPPIVVNIQGPEQEQLLELANDLQQSLYALSSTEIVTTNVSKQPNVTYELNREKMAQNNIAPDDVTSLVRVANTAIPFTTFDNGVERYDMQLLLDDGIDNGVDLNSLQVVANSVTNDKPTLFTLDELVTRKESKQVNAIPHLNGERAVTIEAYPNENATNFSKEASNVVNEFETHLPEGYSFTKDGESSAEQEFFIEVSKLFVIVLFLIYLVMAIQFNSLTLPILITSTVFLAVTGAIVGLFISNQPLSFLAVLGIVSLSGIVVRNSVLLVEFIEQNQKQSHTIQDAIIEAGRARIRPIILTTFTSIAALIPIAVSGDVLFTPLAVSIIAGLAFSTLLTLIMLPAMYILLHRLTHRS